MNACGLNLFLRGAAVLGLAALAALPGPARAEAGVCWCVGVTPAEAKALGPAGTQSLADRRLVNFGIDTNKLLRRPAPPHVEPARPEPPACRCCPCPAPPVHPSFGRPGKSVAVFVLGALALLVAAEMTPRFRWAAQLLAALFFLCAMGSVAQAQCADGNCQIRPRGGVLLAPQQQGFIGQPPPATYEWRVVPDDGDQLGLFRGGIQVGAWSYRHRHYRPLNSGVWGDPVGRAPVEPPQRAEPEPKPGTGAKPPGEKPDPPPQPGEVFLVEDWNKGIDVDKVSRETRYSRRGVEVERGAAFEALGEPGAGREIPDDADTLKMVWVGPPAEADRIRKDLAGAAELREWRGKVSFQAYESLDNPILRDKGYTTGLQWLAPAGKPLVFTADYRGPAVLREDLALAEVRRKDPKWDPEKWRPLQRPDKPPDDTPALPQLPPGGLRAIVWLWRNWLVVLVAVIVLVLVLRRKGA